MSCSGRARSTLAESETCSFCAGEDQATRSRVLHVTTTPWVTCLAPRRAAPLPPPRGKKTRSPDQWPQKVRLPSSRPLVVVAASVRQHSNKQAQPKTAEVDLSRLGQRQPRPAQPIPRHASCQTSAAARSSPPRAAAGCKPAWPSGAGWTRR